MNKRPLRALPAVKSGIVAGLSIALVAAPVMASESQITNRLLARMLNNNMVTTLVAVSEIPWPGGSYSVTMEKVGDATISNGAGDVTVKVPIKTIMKGKVDKDLGFTKVKMDCFAEFDSTGVLNLIPSFAADKVSFKSQVDFPIPPVMANCGSFTFPIDAALQKMVAENKAKWQQQIDLKFTENFNQKMQ